VKFNEEKVMSFFINAAYAVQEASQAASETVAPVKGSGLSTLFLFAVIFLLFYMLIIRPQHKRSKEHRNMVKNLGIGDEVITSGGILGKIVATDDSYFNIEIADNIVIKLQKTYITSSLPKGTCNR